MDESPQFVWPDTDPDSLDYSRPIFIPQPPPSGEVQPANWDGWTEVGTTTDGLSI